MMRQKGKTPSEHQEAVSFIEELTLKFPKEAALLFHIPNEGASNAIKGAKLKREGVKSGVPDYMLPIAKKGFNGLFIELKRKKYYTLTWNQIHWIEALNEQGYKAEFAFGAAHAVEIVTNYLLDSN